MFAEVDVGKAFGAVGFGGLGFEGEAVAAGVEFQRGLVADQAAEVVEVGLGNGRFFLVDLGPLGDELGGGD